MSTSRHFIGDEAAGAGFRLAGFRVHACAPEAAGEVLDRLLSDDAPDLILLAAPHARRLGTERLDELSRACAPPVTVVADAGQTEATGDLVRRVRSLLGVGP